MTLSRLMWRRGPHTHTHTHTLVLLIKHGRPSSALMADGVGVELPQNISPCHRDVYLELKSVGTFFTTQTESKIDVTADSKRR